MTTFHHLMLPDDVSFIDGSVDKYAKNSIPGTTDMTAAITAAVNSGHPVKFKSGATYYHRPIDFEGIDIDWAIEGGDEPATLYCDTSPSSYQAQFKGTVIGSTTVAAAAYPMENVLTLADASDIEVGDLVVIQNSTLWQSDDRGTAFEGQLGKVQEIDGDDIVLDATLTCGMPIGATVAIYRPIAVRMKGIRFERLKINGSSRGVLVFAADEPHIEDCEGVNSSRYCLHVHRCYRGEVRGGVYRGANLAVSESLGYGILVEGCWTTEVRGVTTKECRRGVDITGYTGVPSWYCVVADCRFIGGGKAEDGSDFWPLGLGSAGCGSHGPAVGTLYESNVIVNCYSGITVRGRDETIRGNILVGAMVNPITMQYGGGALIELNRYTDQYEESLETPGTTTDAVSIQRRPNMLVNIAGGYDTDKHLTVRYNTARNVKHTLIYPEAVTEIHHWLIHDNTVVIEDESVPASSVGIINGNTTPDAYDFRGWNNIVIAPTTYEIRKYLVSFVDTVSQIGANTYRVTLTDDTAARIRVGRLDGQIGVRLFRDSANLTPRFNGVLRYENTTNIDWGGTSGVTDAATALTGTTGVDGETTISFADDSVYVENRSGGSVAYILMLEGAH
jgi:hypothetical protein